MTINLKLTPRSALKVRILQGTAGPQGAAGAQGIPGLPGSGVEDGDKGDVTVSSNGAVWTIDAGAVTYAKVQNISATSRFLGRITAGAGSTEELTGTQATTLIDAFTSGLKGAAPASGGGTANFLRADGTWSTPPGTGAVPDGDKGDIVVSGSGATWTVDSGVVTLAKMANMASDRLLGRDTAGSGVPEEISVTGGIEFTGSGVIQVGAFAGGDVTKAAGSGTLTVANDAVTYAKIQNVSATARFLGRITAGAGDTEELTGTQATTLIDPFTDLLKGAAPASGGGTTNFLRADGTWTSPSAVVADGDKGDITVSGSGAVWTIDNDSVSYAKIQNVSATARFLGRITAGAGDTEELTGTQATTLLNNFTDTLKGLAPLSGGGTVNFLRADGTWASPAASSGSVVYNAVQTLTDAEQKQARTNVSAPLNGYIFGLTLSNNGTDATNDIDVAAGSAASTETNPVLMVLASAITKRLDAAWAVGTNQGGLDTGSIANVSYHVWLIRRSDTGVVDALFSASATAPTMPTNYDQKRRIGSIMRAAAAIRLFTQRGNEFLHAVPIQDVSGTAMSTAGALVALSVPVGVVVGATFTARVNRASAGFYTLFTSPDQANTTPSLTAFNVITNATVPSMDTQIKGLRTNTSAQIRQRSEDATITYYVITHGWEDRRDTDL